MERKEIEEIVDAKIKVELTKINSKISKLLHSVNLNWGAFVAFLAFIIIFMPNINNLSKLDAEELNKVPALIRQQNAQIEFNNLTVHMIEFVQKIYHPNLQVDTEDVPSDTLSAINNNLIELNSLIKDGAKENAEYHLIMGLYYCGERSNKIEDVDNAIKHFEKYIELRPYDSNVLTNLGLCYELCEEHKIDRQKARAYFTKALIFDKSYCRAHYNLANLDYKEGNTKDAHDRIDVLIANHPQCPEGYFVKSKFLVREGHTNEAYRFLSLAVENGFDDLSWLLRSFDSDENFKKSTAYKNAVNKLKRARFIN